jgi:protein translocase SecG subunit
MSYIAGLLTCILLLNSVMLILLVLVQLPKKDAGAGLAFGGGAADALFGAGSGNALTKITKWGTVVFIVLALALGYLQDSLHSKDTDTVDFLKKVNQKQTAPASMPSSMPAPAPVPQPAAPATKNVLSGISLGATNPPAAPLSLPAK